jgi:hypothetical protein
LHPYRTAGKIIVLFILIFTFLTAHEKTKGYGLNGSKQYQNSAAPQFLVESNFNLLLLFPNTLTVQQFQMICLQV